MHVASRFLRALHADNSLHVLVMRILCDTSQVRLSVSYTPIFSVPSMTWWFVRM